LSGCDAIKFNRGKQLNQIKKEWPDEFHWDFGPLKTESISDPQHHPLDPRKKPRQVDALESLGFSAGC